MDGTQDKKWFVYMTDHHEGPFSLAEIQGKMAEKVVSVSNYVWCDGMADWKIMTEVPEFEVILKPAVPPGSPKPPLAPAAPVITFESQATDTAVTAHKTEAAQEIVLPTLEEKPEEVSEASNALAESQLSQPLKFTDSSHEASPMPASATAPIHEDGLSQEGGTKRKTWLVILLIVLFFGVGGFFLMQAYKSGMIQSTAVTAVVQAVNDVSQPYLMKLSEWIPPLQKWISPIPTLEDVSVQEQEELKVSARGRPEQTGVRIGVALSNADPTVPSFYLSTNLPDGVIFDVYVEGIADTLLNQTAYSSGKIQVTTVKKLAKTQGLRYPNGMPLPKGEYIVYVMEAEGNQPTVIGSLLGSAALDSTRSVTKLPKSLPANRKWIISKSYFLGGKKDDVYRTRLQDYHKQKQTQVADEMKLAKQYFATLESQLLDAQTKYDKISKMSKPVKGKIVKILPAQKKAWNAYHDVWNKFFTQLKQPFSKWTPTALETEFYHGILFRLIQQAADAVERVHSVHHSFFTTTPTPQLASIGIQIGEATSVAKTALDTLKVKIEFIEKLGMTPNGLPRKEEL